MINLPVLKSSDTKLVKIVRNSMHDLSVLGKVFTPEKFYKPVPPYAKKISDLLLDDNKLSALIAFRGSGKSIYSSFLLPLHYILFPRLNRQYIVLVSESPSQAKENMEALQIELSTNKDIHAVFGDYAKKSPVWNRFRLTTNNLNTTISAKSIKSAMRGIKYDNHRVDLVVLDDFESESNSLTENSIQKIYNSIDAVLLPSLSDTGIIRAVGTPINDLSYLVNLEQTASSGNYSWKSLDLPCFTKDNKSQWEEMYPLKDLLNKKQYYLNKGQERYWYREYEVKIVYIEGGFWSMRQINHYDSTTQGVDNIGGRNLHYVMVNEEKHYLYTFVAIDLAASITNTAAYTAIMGIGVDANGNVFVLDYDRDRMLPDQQVSRTIQMADKLDAENITVETIAYQSTMKFYLEKALDESNKYYDVIEDVPHASKEERYIAYLQPLIKYDNFWMDKNIQTELRTEMALVKGKFKDLKDALVMSIKNSYKFDYPFSNAIEAKSYFKPSTSSAGIDSWIKV